MNFNLDHTGAKATFYSTTSAISGKIGTSVDYNTIDITQTRQPIMQNILPVQQRK